MHMISSGVGLTFESLQHVLWSGLSALEFLSAKKIVHRDIKPENFLVCHEGRIKLGDFGISARERVKGIRAAGGTEGYMAPENMAQLEDSPLAQLYKRGYDCRSDFWSRGRMALVLFSAQLPDPNALYEVREGVLSASSNFYVCCGRCHFRVTYPENTPFALLEFFELSMLMHAPCCLNNHRTLAYMKALDIFQTRPLVAPQCFKDRLENYQRWSQTLRNFRNSTFSYNG